MQVKLSPRLAGLAREFASVTRNEDLTFSERCNLGSGIAGEISCALSALVLIEDGRTADKKVINKQVA